MLTELCGYLKNWFEVKMYYGNFAIDNNTIAYADGQEIPMQEGQYFRIIGSVFNDGIYANSSFASGESDEDSSEGLKNESFTGAVWLLAIPNEVIDLSKEISAWRTKYEGSDSAMMSPFNSESFGGYSYSKGSASDGSNSWQSVFSNRLKRYRKC